MSSTETELYAGRADEAWRRVKSSWGPYQRSLLGRHEALFIEALSSRARSALALASGDVASRRPSERRLLSRAVRDADRIDREDNEWGAGLAALIRAGVHATRGNRDACIEETERSVQIFHDLDMALHELVAHRRRAELRGASNETARFDARMQDLGIQNPARVTSMLAPGRWV